ncbi:hypothetical protein [Akkermansia sp.]|uniref:hypothetical protein n=1 Tax=Akkermansia sp. TaxID=1872421 RepID=UPI0025BD1227|nr:hypothetical protein [Akkermansia sp.]
MKHMVEPIPYYTHFPISFFQKTLNKHNVSSPNRAANPKNAEYDIQAENDFIFSVHIISLQLFTPFHSSRPDRWEDMATCHLLMGSR